MTTVAPIRFAECADCRHTIFRDDDEACICIECGGMNRRVPHDLVAFYIELGCIVLGLGAALAGVFYIGRICNVW